MKTLSYLILIIFTSTISISNLYAVKATPYPFSITQSDGSKITVFLKGDEFYHYKTSIDGYTLIPNSDGILTYAKFETNGKLVSTNFRANNVEKRTLTEKRFIQKLERNVDLRKLSQVSRMMRSSSINSISSPKKSYPLIGKPKSLVILINFSDVSFVTANPQTAFTNLLNQKGYSANSGTGSARDYFNDNSMGVFNPEFDVVGPFTLSNNMAFYGTNDTNGSDNNPQQMVIDACTEASKNGVDFSKYDSDNDGIVDNVFIYYAGYNEAEGGPATSIWPHRWSLSNLSTKFNGVSVYDYACTSELRSKSGSNMCGIGTFCHEFGHVLGLPDFYNTTDQTKFTLSYWDIMDAGPYLNSGRTPPSYSSYERFFLKWLVPTELETAGDYSLETLGSSNKAYLISQSGNHNLNGESPSPAEFFMLENRQNTGWDTYLFGHGMLITHVYYNGSTWSNNTPNNDPNALGVSIVEADNSAVETAASLAGDPFPGTSHVTAFNPILRDKTDIRKPLANIQENNGFINFHFASNIIFYQNIQSFSTVQGTPSAIQIVTVSGTKLKNVINISFKIGQHFEMKKESDPDSGWGKSIILVPTDSVVNKTNIQIRYNPTVPSYFSTHSDTFILSSGLSDYADVSLSGTSTRPVYVVPPVANDAIDVTFASFIANWNNVPDASGYYLTVYNISDGESSLTEGFDKGLSAPNNWTITAYTTTSSTLYSGTKIPALQFSNTGELVETEKYLLPITKLSFYIRSLGGNNGGFLVEAQNELNSWMKVDSIAVTSTLKEIKTYTFSESNGYTRFRFTYTKGIGSVTFDDVTVNFAKNISYIEREKWLTTTFDTISNLSPSTEYVYKVRASDKNIVNKYENITLFSNAITTKILPYPLEKKLLVIPDAVGNVKVFFPSLDVTLYIYNILGQCIKTIIPDSNTITITDLPRNQIYILKANNRVTKIAI